MDQWSDFATLMGTTFGVLIGLLFVGLSLHADQLSAAPGLRSRIAQVLVIFIGLLAATAVLTIPAINQVLGGLLLLDSAGLVVPLALLNKGAKGGKKRARLEVLLDRINPNIITISLLATTGVLLILDLDWGMYFLFAAAIIGMIGGLFAAWFVLLRPAIDMEEIDD